MNTDANRKTIHVPIIIETDEEGGFHHILPWFKGSNDDIIPFCGSERTLRHYHFEPGSLAV
jgi:hypothetical protein